MTSQTPDMQAVLERLEKLDKQNRSLKRCVAISSNGPTGSLLLLFLIRLPGPDNPALAAEAVSACCPASGARPHSVVEPTD